MNEQPPSTCIYICHVFTWYPGGPEKDIRLPGTGVTVVSYHMGAGN